MVRALVIVVALVAVAAPARGQSDVRTQEVPAATVPARHPKWRCRTVAVAKLDDVCPEGNE